MWTHPFPQSSDIPDCTVRGLPVCCNYTGSGFGGIEGALLSHPGPSPRYNLRRGGGGGGEGGKIPTRSDGLCFWLGGKPRNAATGGVPTLPFTSCVSRRYFCDAFCDTFVWLKVADWRGLVSCFCWRKRRLRHYSAAAVARQCCAMNENCFWTSV